jgi:hypothetical protein
VRGAGWFQLAAAFFILRRASWAAQNINRAVHFDMPETRVRQMPCLIYSDDVNVMRKLLHTFYRTVFLSLAFLVLIGMLSQVRVFGQHPSGAQIRISTNTQGGTAYTIQGSDCGKLVSFSNSSAVAVALPQAGSAGIVAGCWMDIQNVGPGMVTLTPVNSLIDQSANIQLTANQGMRLVSNGTAYLTQRGQGSGSVTGSGSGTVTAAVGALVKSALVTGNNGTDLMTPAPAATMDSGGNISIPGTLSTNTSCSGCAGAIDLKQGTDPGAGQGANSFSLIAPQSIGSAFRWKVPPADAAGAIVSDGQATPGTLSIVPFSGTNNIARTTSPVITTATLVQPIVSNYTVATLPAGVTLGKLAYVTDGSTASDCTTGGGSSKVLCAFDGGVWAFPGGATSTGTGTGSGTVTAAAGALVKGALVIGNNGTDLKTPVSAATMDNSGNISIPGTLTTNTSCSGCAGAIDLRQGTDPGAGQGANTFSWVAPQSIGSAYRWKVPSADAAGAIVSDGQATPGTLSIVPFSGTNNIARTTSPVITTATLIQPIISNYTVSTLPAGVTLGKLAYVTDGNTATDCTVGGGSNKVMCVFNGVAWAFPGGVLPSATNARRVCSIVIGADNGVALATTDIAPQGRQCLIPAAATVVEIDVAADGGTPAVILARNHAGTLTDLSASLATASAGGLACANAGGTGAGMDGTTTCGVAITTPSLAAGDWIETHTSAGASTAKRMSISVVYTVN